MEIEIGVLRSQCLDRRIAHVEPAGVLGRVVERKPEIARDLRRPERPYRRCRRAGSTTRTDIKELAHAGDEVHSGAAVGDVLTLRHERGIGWRVTTGRLGSGGSAMQPAIGRHRVARLMRENALKAR